VRQIKLTYDILDLEVQEKTSHDNVWKKRRALVKRIHNVLREAETEVAAREAKCQSSAGNDSSQIAQTRKAKTNVVLSRAQDLSRWVGRDSVLRFAPRPQRRTGGTRRETDQGGGKLSKCQNLTAIG